jgi:predicted dehydrogenase
MHDFFDDMVSDVAPLRGAVVGLGMMGRHHARLLQAMPQVAFAGAVDPAGDRHAVLRDGGVVYESLEALLSAGPPPDFAVVAVPTADHLGVAETLAAAGVAFLIEKPLAATAEEGRRIIRLAEETGVRGAVGHVERCNPALLELRRRLRAGQLGEVFLIATERIGPFPARVRDIGVVKDLATHDLDLVRWIGGSAVESVAAQTSHRMGREHEDVVLATGRLAGGTTFNCQVDWISPTKRRRTRVLGEKGMFVADTLTGDLTFYENAHVPSEWPAAQALRGVSEGDATRYALSRREPLLVELEAFCAYVAGGDDVEVVSLPAGLETVITAEAVQQSARTGQTVSLAPVGTPG